MNADEVQHPIAQVVKAIVDLGIATQAAMDPHVAAWQRRPPSEDTSDEDIELSGFLTALHQAGVLTRNQGRALLMMLAGRAGAPPGDPYLSRRFGSFIAEAKLGEGGMGKVYRASREGSLEGDYVVKVFTSHHDPAALARFRRECEVMTSLDHPNIVRVHGAGQEDDLPYLVLEYVEGPTLQALVEERGRFSWKSATRAVKQVTSALAAAHESGVIHRDVKPSNILVARGGVLKVCDFGLAKTMDSKVVSHAGEILGSPAYMAPEQWGDHEVDHRADLFALGVIYYLLLTGRAPFRGRTPADYSWKIQAGKYDPVETYAPEVPIGVRWVVAQLLERDRTHRPPQARDVLADLDRVLRGGVPNVPRLEPTDERVGEEPVALVGSPTFEVGSGPRAAVRLVHASVDDLHARLERTLGGILIRDLDSAGGTWVNGQRIREMLLRDKDVVRFGEAPEVRYRVGNAGARASGRFATPSSDKLRTLRSDDEMRDAAPAPTVVPGLVAAALQDAGDPRAIVGCFEALDVEEMIARLEVSRRRLRRIGLGREEASRVVERARVACQERLWRVSDTLFKTTHENLGRSVESWLAWWFEMRRSYPQQVRPPGGRARGRLVVTRSADAPGEPITFDLAQGEEWTLGRSEEVELTVPERSVSRRHLLIVRLLTRFGFMDLGSRFGTTVGGARREVGLLAHGDVLGLGRARGLFEDALRDESAIETQGGECPPVDLNTFQALVDLRSPTVAQALVRLLDVPGLSAACGAASPAAHRADLEPVLTGYLAAWREAALEALPAIVGRDLGDDEGWTAWLEAEGERLPPQVEPEGWTGDGGFGAL